MPTALPQTLEAAAAEAAGNWQHFDSFSWHESDLVKDADKWGIFNTRTRDSEILEISNHEAILAELKPFMGKDVMGWSANHWAVGWTEGFRVRVFNKKGEITPAFRRFYALQERLAEYPVLDEDEFNRMEYEAGLENIDQIVSSVTNKYDEEDLVITADTPREVFSWLWNNDDTQCESVDGRGCWPDDEAVERALWAIRAITRPVAYPGPDDLVCDINRLHFVQGGQIVVLTDFFHWAEDVRKYFDEEKFEPKCFEEQPSGQFLELNVDTGDYTDD